MKKLNPIIHSALRLAVISLLITLEEADFNLILSETKSTAGNLSVQLTKLEKVGYITIDKTFKGKKPNTVCKITKKGIREFDLYVKNLKSYLNI
jgi:DNA-binding PadR family transcriptional regulator